MLRRTRRYPPWGERTQRLLQKRARGEPHALPPALSPLWPAAASGDLDMIGIVRTALARPLTFIVMAILIAIVGVLAAIRTPVDIFPEIRVPVIAVAWQYAGLSPDEMSG